MAEFDELIKLSETLIEESKAALEACRREDYAPLKAMMERLDNLTKTEIQMVLARVQLLPQGKPLFFDVVKIAEEIEKDIKQCNKEWTEPKKASKVLQRIVGLEKEILKKELNLRMEIILASKVAGEAALMMFVRFQIDPYVRYLGQQLDVAQYKVTHLGEFVKHQSKTLWESINIFKKKSEIVKEDLVVTNEKIMSQYTGLVGHPVYIPHFKFDEPYEYLFSDGIYLSLLTAFAAVVVLKNIPTYIRKKRDAAKIKKIYYQLNKQMQSQLNMFADHIRMKSQEVNMLNRELTQLEGRIKALETPESNQAAILAEHERRISQLHDLISNSYQEVDKKATELGKEAGEIVKNLAG